MIDGLIIGAMLFKKKILCYVLIFDQIDIIKQSIDFLCGYSDRLDIIVIENPSPQSPEIKKYIQTLGDQKLIKRHYLFSKNITGNAYTAVLAAESNLIKKSRFVILTDGDLKSSDDFWLDEEIAILNNHRDVFACGISLDKSNLPIKTFPEAKGWIPDDDAAYDDYYQTWTGGHLLMLRGAELYNFLEWRARKNLSFVDGNMHMYCREINKHWARTKKSQAYHLTWDLYTDLNHPYTRMKTDKTFKQTWYHKRNSSYTLKEF